MSFFVLRDSTNSSNQNPTKIKFVHLEELWNFGIHLFSNWHHLQFENLDSSYEMLYFLIMIVETHWHDMQWTPWSRLCCHKNVGKNFMIWTSFEKYKQLWSYDYTNQIIKLIRTMNNSRTHPNLGTNRWGPQLFPMDLSRVQAESFEQQSYLQVGPATLSTDGVTQSQIFVRLNSGPRSGWVHASLTFVNRPTPSLSNSTHSTYCRRLLL
jgi:hypothetical protein